MEKKNSVKIVHSKKLPADFSTPLHPPPEEVRPVARPQLPEPREKKSSRKSKNPFRPFFNYIQQAQLCAEEIKQLPDLNLEKVEQLIVQKPRPLSPQLRPEHCITIGTIKGGHRSGPLRKVLYAPTFSLIAIREQPIPSKAARLDLKQWVCVSWKALDCYDQFLKLVYTPNWNRAEDCAAIYCELAQGGSLQDLLRACVSLSEKAVRQMTIQLLQAYSVIGKQRIKYNCLSPTQVLFTNEGRVKLSLGLASKLHVPAQPARAIWQLDFAPEDLLSSQVFKIGLIALYAVLGSFDLHGRMEQLLAEVVRRINSKDCELCCIIHSEHSLLKSEGKLTLELLLGANSPELQDFLCRCLRVVPEQRPKVQALLGHPFISKITNFRTPSIKEMLRLSCMSDIPKQFQTVAQLRMGKFLESLGQVLAQLRGEELTAVSGKCITTSPTIRGLAAEFGLSEAATVLRVRQLLSR